MRALIVDGDRDLLDVMAYALRRAGHEVITAGDGQQALDRLQADRPDIVLLELKLGRVDGFEVCRRIRLASEVPIIVVSSSREEPDVLRAFGLGADDYVTKPCSLKVLAARMKTVSRRCRADASERAARTVKAGDLELSLQSCEATRGGGEPFPLTPLEFRILYLLAMNEGRVVPYARLVDYVWGVEGGDAHRLKSRIHHLKTRICYVRAKLGLPPAGPGAIRALATIGYSLVKHRGMSGAVTVPPPQTRTAREERSRLMAG